jgi:hypothetical protein
VYVCSTSTFVLPVLRRPATSRLTSLVLSSHSNCQECSDNDERKNEVGKDDALRGRTITETTFASAVSRSSSNNNDYQEPVDVTSESTGDGRESPAPRLSFITVPQLSAESHTTEIGMQ